MRVLLWHGWLLEGSGSNVYTAKTTEHLRRAGHDVVLLCQEPDPARFGFFDAWGSVSGDGVADLHEEGVPRASGRAVLLRPRIGSLLPVFVLDEYEGFRVKRFVDLDDDELDAYLEANVLALQAAAGWHVPEAVVVGHAVPGAVVGRRALGCGRYVAKVHGSDVEYAIRLQDRYAHLATEGLQGARAVIGASRDVLERAEAVVPEIRLRTRVIPPGVDSTAWRPEARTRALEQAAIRLERNPDRARGRPTSLEVRVEEALDRRDARALDDLALAYDQAVPDPDSPRRLRALTGRAGPLVGYLGKLIPQKGVHHLLSALALLPGDVHALVMGFGLFREWLSALVLALDEGDSESCSWVGAASEIEVELTRQEIESARGLRARVSFTGRLDHRYAPRAVAALDVLVVPSILDEAFGMVATEGAAAGALPLVARHSGLAEVAADLEKAVGADGVFSFEPGSAAPTNIAAGVERLLALPRAERDELRAAVSGYVAREWSWDGTVERLLQTAADPGGGV